MNGDGAAGAARTGVVERIEARVHGRVQGVGFRWFTLRAASRLGLSGWVANSPDGTVQVIAEGPADRLTDLVRALEVGPSGAAVDRVEVARAPATGSFRRFEVRSGHHSGD